MGSGDEVLLTTAWLDRAWWRGLEEHVAFCLVNGFGESGSPNESQAALASGTNGARDTDAWSRSDDTGSPRKGGGFWGDPHLTTFDGHGYDLQAKGEVVLVESVDDDVPFDVHARFEPNDRPDAPEACRYVTWGRALGVRLGDVRLQARTGTSGLEVSVDGQRIEPPALPPLPPGYSLELAGADATLTDPDGTRVAVKARFRTLTVSVSPAEIWRGRLRGLLGDFDGDPQDDLRSRDGTLFEVPVSFDDLYGPLATSWRLSQDESLLPYAAGETTETFTDLGFPGESARAASLPAELRAEAALTCEQSGVVDPALLETCVLDVVCAAEAGLATEAAATPAPSAVSPPEDGAPTAFGDVRLVEGGAEIDGAESFVDTPPIRPACSPTTPTASRS